jgi:hypothetical protein
MSSLAPVRNGPCWASDADSGRNFVVTASALREENDFQLRFASRVQLRLPCTFQRQADPPRLGCHGERELHFVFSTIDRHGLLHRPGLGHGSSTSRQRAPGRGSAAQLTAAPIESPSVSLTLSACNSAGKIYFSNVTEQPQSHIYCMVCMVDVYWAAAEL